MNYGHSMNGIEQVITEIEYNHQAATQGSTSCYISNFANTAI